MWHLGEDKSVLFMVMLSGVSIEMFQCLPNVCLEHFFIVSYIQFLLSYSQSVVKKFFFV